ncbi:MAG TPA: condensation domain-containing protein, partial [Bryobacteraceae bacterium]
RAAAPSCEQPRAGPARISLLQERLWFLAQIDPASTAYHVNVAVRLTGTLHPSVLESALDEVVKRHEILRTTFANSGDTAIQIVHPDWPARLPVIDIRDDAFGSRPFNLEATPAWRAALVRESESEWVLLLCMHHLIGDAWSLAVFAKELSLLYSASIERRTVTLPAPLQYAAFSEWHRQRFEEDGFLRTQLEWWKRQLAGPLTELRLFSGRAPKTPLLSRGASYQQRFAAGLPELLRALSRKENATLFMTLLAGFKTLLYCYSGQEDVIVGTDVANRNHLEAESAIGFFVNTIVLRTDLKSNPDFREVLRRVRNTALGAYAHQDTPFHQIVQAVNPARDAGRNPLFQVLFLLQNTPQAAIEIPGVRATPLELGHDSAAFDLSVLTQETPDGGIVAVFRYDTAKFEAGAIARMAGDFERILNEAAARAETRLAEFRKMAGEEVTKPVDPKPKALRGLEGLTKKAAAPQRFQTGSLVKSRVFEPGRKLPLIVEPAVPEIDTVPWLRESREWIEARMVEHGGILFRGFHVDSAERLEGFAREMCHKLIEYGERSSPRTSIQGRVYSSTDHPPDQRILLHCEQSYTLEWPMRIWFCCLEPALRGGRTPIASTREITQSIDPRVVDEFSKRGVMYVRNYGGGLGLPWQDAFQTSDRQAVEDYCRQAAIDFEWRGEERLRTRQLRPALRKHPSTAEWLWFNHALFFHVSSLDPATRESILAGVPEDELPFNTYYGDGGRIEESELQPIRDAYASAEFSFDWERGDVLVLDNMLAAHGREAFEGARKIAVVMGDPYRASSGAASAV